MYKEDLALNNLQWLICHKNKPKPNPNQIRTLSENQTHHTQELICDKNLLTIRLLKASSRLFMKLRVV